MVICRCNASFPPGLSGDPATAFGVPDEASSKPTLLKGRLGSGHMAERIPKADHPFTHRLPEARGLVPPSPSAIYARPSIRSCEWGWLGEGRPAGARSCDRNLNVTSPPGVISQARGTVLHRLPSPPTGLGRRVPVPPSPGGEVGGSGYSRLGCKVIIQSINGNARSAL